MFGKRGTPSGTGGPPVPAPPNPIGLDSGPATAPPPLPAPTIPAAKRIHDTGDPPPPKPVAVDPPRPAPEPAVRRSENFYDVKSTVFSALIDTIDLSQLARLDIESARE